MQKINPFYEKATDIEKSYEDWNKLNSKPYDKAKTSPYTKTRIIFMNGTEFEANWFMHQFHRHCSDNNLRREIAKIRRREQQQQKIIASLKPMNESILETTISYEQLAVDLTAILAQKEQRHREKQREFFREAMSGKTTPPDTKTSTGNIGISMAKVDDRTVSAVVNSLKQKGIKVSPENISQMIAQHFNQNYTLEQIAAIVEVDCERQHAREQAKTLFILSKKLIVD